MIKEEILKLVKNIVPEDIHFDIEFQEDGKFGHYSTSVAFALAKKEKKLPSIVAKEIIEILQKNTLFEKIEIAAGGFINFWISKDVLRGELKNILEKKGAYGQNKKGSGKKIRIEYVSANPTGPIHIGNARGGPYGESLARVYEESGYEVLREYLHNDVGGQIDKLGETLWYWYEKKLGKDATFPEGGYQGEYLEEVVTAALKKFENKENITVARLTEFGLDYIFENNMGVLKRMGILFDLIRKESELISSGKTQEAIDITKKKGATKENEGALWFSPKDEFLEDREAVIVKSNGRPTYFASDIAYHKEKFESGYDFVIDVFGSNHHGHVPKLQALTKLFGYDSEKFKVLLYQFVRVKRGNEVIKMSKRAGTYVTTEELLDEVGRDNVVFSLLSSAPTTHIDFDLEAVKQKSMQNPVYYVQYAYVRARSIGEKAGTFVLDPTIDLSYLHTNEDLFLIRKLIQFPEIIDMCVSDFEVHRLTRYATELARAFHNFYEKEHVIGEKEEIFQARIFLIEATKIVFENLFRVIGINIPESM
ncbi:MAG: arginine--tRNA ligase [Patescibacteria group bacterium]